MALSNTYINIKVNSDTIIKAQDIFSNLGIDMSTAINTFLKESIRRNGIPFRIVNDQVGKLPRFGYMKDSIWEDDDHDWFESMDDFKECM